MATQALNPGQCRIFHHLRGRHQLAGPANKGIINVDQTTSIDAAGWRTECTTVENKLNELHELLQGIVREGDRLTYKGKKYVRETRWTIFCKVTELQLVKGYLQHSPGETPEMKPSFKGKARLKTDTICLVGTDLSEMRELDLFIDLAEPQDEPTLLTEEQRAAKAARDGPLDWRDAIYGQDAITRISFFMPDDWDIGMRESLSLDIHAPRAMFDALQSAFESGRLHGVSLGLKCGLWVEESSKYLPFVWSTKWFLFPERVYSSGKISFETAHGWLSHFSINSAPLRLGIQDEDPPDVRAAAPPAITDADRRTLRSISRALWWLVALAVLALIRAGIR